ncbi:leucine-rich repeat receptor protein kinase HPCA1-like [Hordeum vulgare subsp. vulgare]|uniref:non-specific serine/threonine protein kinase n=1 Tax=Hordeum vulgare subsp. vulgare TaxID=112509 RepID=M0WQQ4_HORVV|nr:leucine-rich repeat receptor protein kinase HPCA1-like [Hordeum vulgare subsp. vulgare]
MEAATRRALLLLLLLVAVTAPAGLCQTNPDDAAALRSLMGKWTNYPPSWNSGDPCGAPWDGIMCTNGRVTSLRLSSVNMQGTLSDSVGQLGELVFLDLSFNSGLSGTIPASIGNLAQLTTLILAGCSFSGDIPKELGNLLQMTFLALNSNKLTGTIPPQLGLLSKLFWLDLADNAITGTVPISTGTTPGLDLLINTKHFHFNKNQLSGTLTGLFNSKMTLIHILFDSNQFSGPIPRELGGIRPLQVLRLDRNQFAGAIPNISNLVSLNELNLASNKLTGSLPDLSQMNVLNVVDLSNNTFSASEIPVWFANLTNISSISMSSAKLTGVVPQELFNLPQLHEVVLSKNQLSGTLRMAGSISTQLQTVDLEQNSIVDVSVTSNYKKTLLLARNPVCADTSIQFCTAQRQNVVPYSTSMTKCNLASGCQSDQGQNPANCGCSYSYNGKMVFRAPSFKNVADTAKFQELEQTLSRNLSLREGAVQLSGIQFNGDNYLQVQVKLFPSTGTLFNVSEVSRIGSLLSNQIYKPPPIFGPYFFIADPYVPFIVAGGQKSKFGTGAIAGIAAGGGVLVIALIFVGLFALRQKRRNKELKERSTDPFASWGATQKDSGGAPQLKGARFFSFEELKSCTDNFADSHEIGAGGYGKVYKGTLVDGIRVAIKRAQSGSMQGAPEFKNEIELLSRVHHRNLVSLIGFCFQQGEQMLVYEFVAGGTLRENLAVRGTYLGWKKRLRIALGSARGLAYLHELADPPIIHRDIKSTNILLDENLKAKVADFGLSKLVADTEKGHVSTQVKGTLGYLDPEYYMTQQLSEKSDVYSFGVVMLELVSGRQPIEKGKYVVREVRQAIDPADRDYYGLRAILDPAIRDAARTPGFRRFVQLAMQCVDESAAARPTMGTVVKEVEAMLLNEPDGEGLNSAGSSATEFDGAGRGAPSHPYSDVEITRSSYGGAGDASDYMPYFEVKPK